MKRDEKLAIGIGLAGIALAWYWSRQQLGAIGALLAQPQGPSNAPARIDPLEAAANVAVGNPWVNVPGYGTPLPPAPNVDLAGNPIVPPLGSIDISWDTEGIG